MVTVATPNFPLKEFQDWVLSTLGPDRYKEFLDVSSAFRRLTECAVNDGAATITPTGVEWNTIELLQEYLDNRWPEELRRPKYYWAQTKRDWLKSRVA
jgi:hypothetical protein